MPAHVGRDPRWFEAVPEFTKSGRMRKTLKSGNMEWDLSEGWHAKRAVGWKGRGKKTMVETENGKAPMVYKSKIIGVDGKEYELYKTRGYDDYLGFSAGQTSDTDALAYAQAAFDEASPSYNVKEHRGCGHIDWIAYSVNYQVLKVWFKSNGAVCVFFRVPSAVAGQLLHYAENPDNTIIKNGVPRHMLGIEFWKLIRIRGQIRGARYPFEYEKHGTYRLTKSNKRYVVTLSDKNFKTILGDKYVGPLKPGDKITSILSPEEYAKWVTLSEGDTFEHGSARLGVQVSTYVDKEGDEVEREQTGGSYEQDMLAEMQHRLDIEKAGKQSVNTFTGLTKDEHERFDAYKKQYEAANEQYKSDVVKGRLTDIMSKEAEARASNPALFAMYEAAIRAGDVTQEEMIMNLHSLAETEDAYDKRLRGENIGGMRTWVDKVRREIPKREAFDTYEDYLDFLRLDKKSNAPKSARQTMGRVWKPSDLIARADVMRKEGIDPKYLDSYNAFVKSRDWHGALNFLKTHRGNLYTEEGKLIASKFYAGNEDIMEE